MEGEGSHLIELNGEGESSARGEGFGRFSWGFD